MANSRRTLDCIGWQYAEPVLRSLAYALLAHEDGNPKQADAPADRPWRSESARAASPARSIGAKAKPIRPPRPICWPCCTPARRTKRRPRSSALSAAGVGPQSIWDAVFVGAGELLLRQRGIVALHAVTTANALHYAFATCGDDQTRRMLLLQAAAFVAEFRDAMQSRGKVSDADLAKLEPLPLDRRPAAGRRDHWPTSAATG